MADIRGFRGFRYDLGQVGSLSDVVAPPYDVIDPALQKQLYDQSPYNAIRVELTKDEPGDDDLNNRYTRAAGTLRDWVASNALRQDTARAVYIYEQTFTAEGQEYTRRGFFARVRLEPFGQGKIYPHEQTMSGPKADRLKLYQATGFNVSPVFGLYPDRDGEVARVLEPFTLKAPPVVAKDHLGVTNKLWVVTDTHAISTLTGLMGPKPVYIADGHHRYETGVKYLEERKAAGEVADDEAAPNFTLMMLVGMTDPGLIILPTHRLFSGLTAVTSAELEALLGEHFDVVERTGTDAKAAWDHIQMDGSQAALGFGTVADGKWFVAKLRDPRVMTEAAPEQSDEWRGLGVSILHKLVVDRLVAPKLGTPAVKYVHLLKEVTDAVAAKECQLAVLVPPATMEHVEQIAGNGEKMPAKSTYFYPKLLTGMVYNSLKKD
ncbi:Uncharacterized protein OS=Singulisphaera acidiphila (strain ATCC BAA-1392 / DSM 18658 / VKM B-2454 / MOB10) GN=Sinac_1570 PE=4 SV=1: DUF1015 [Gemmataceae bacterium]|nr:Uncharacterized protein OS=Singulisphaera acidiphila (strain ATCC BAA-1392 / DSM 18658 / VKM B-2454 / MOB10) GN=Sinac_1570 PE=4 SV=1: DUF1015 [Gemmataceae bacterium]VTU00121.1 Uncharacterized protein OS=Singulisphaera acidiphila (strain ATCC BAA-1392 / DSM 18658 / VKM B-2454 / MOB10) GN=Sinac_1570 PE=4 SV=1: DUF1015 [Gemmataceae bacterium]